MNIKVKNVKGGEKLVSVSAESSVYEMKSAIFLQFSIPEEHQKLLYKGRILEDSKQISEYSIKDSDTVVLMSTYTPPTPAPLVPAPATIEETEESLESETVRSGTFNFLLGNPEFEKIVNIIRSNPREFENFIVQLESTNPELYDLINENKKEFIELIRGRDTESDQLQLTRQEFTDVKELMALGFSAQDCLEAYLGCGKNKEAAANLLFSGFQ
jgi:Ubiquitin family/XPC-binding domain/UBA/TS-N domain